MTIKSQIARLESSVEEFVMSAASLDEELYLSTQGSWSPRDIVAHLVGWNRHIIEGSKQIMKGELPFYDKNPGKNYSKVNAAIMREYPSENREELLEELRTSARELKQFLKTLKHSQWIRDFGVRHRGETITIRNTVEDLIADYDHHREQIDEW
jgi:hypothetical protein